VGATGATSLTGTLTFGIGTQSNNGLGSASVYTIDGYGNFPLVTFNGVNYISPGLNSSFIDSGSNAMYFSDYVTLGIPDCPGDLAGYYCPASTQQYSAKVYGVNGASTTVNWSTVSAQTLIATFNSVFINLGGDSGVGASTDYVDLGLPFFMGRTVFVGIQGASTTYPSGYWAF
jgi:hypothetical protein